MNAQMVSGRALNVITNALASKGPYGASRTPLEVLIIKGCGIKTFYEIVELMQRNGYWQDYDERGRPR